MKQSAWYGLAGQLLRFLAVLAILIVLGPKLLLAFANLYDHFVHQDRVPSGNPLKVEAPLLKPDSGAPFVFKSKLEKPN